MDGISCPAKEITVAAEHPTVKFKSPDAIKEYRRKHHLNQSTFWGRVGVGQSGGSHYESGRNIPVPVQLLLQLAYGTPKQAADMLAWMREQDPI